MIAERRKIMTQVNELADKLTGLSAIVTKIASEVQALKDALANTAIPAEAQTALDNLTAQLTAVDDLNPDA